jgi:citrate synthase
MTKRDAGWMSAADAARKLDVSRATLYAYVSRGLVRSEAQPGAARRRRYSREDVERLRRRSEERRDPQKAAARALQWGVPVLESSITLIADGALFYRGHDATELARSRSVEDVASLVWTGGFGAAFTDTPLHAVSGAPTPEPMAFSSRAQSVVSMVGASDPLASDLRPHAVAECGWRILNLLTSIAIASPDLAATADETLATGWRAKGPYAAELIRAALILCADHELNVSSFTARCIASAGSNPYAAVVGGLAAIEGVKHGGVTVRVEELFDASGRPAPSMKSALAARLRRGEAIEGFGHPIYPAGDPRAATLLGLLRDTMPKSKELARSLEVAAAAHSLLDEEPTIDFALVALARALRLPSGSALTLFAIGRTIGWIGHAIEQYASGAVIRPRAKYVGVMPGSTSS